MHSQHHSGSITGRGSLAPVTTLMQDEHDESNVVSIGKARIRRLVAELPKRHRLIVTWRYGLDGLTLSYFEIGKRLGVGPAVVRHTELDALRLLHDRALVAQSEREVV